MEKTLTEKKKAKKKSSSTIIKELRERLKKYKEAESMWRRRYHEKRVHLEELEVLFPKKYFKIAYKAKCQDGDFDKCEEICAGVTVEDAIRRLCRTLLYPDTFELIDIEQRV